MIPIEKTVKKFLRTEAYTTFNGYVRERDIFGVYLKEVEVDASGVLITPDIPLAEISTNERPKGTIFKGKNRKQRRKEKKEGRLW